MSIDILVQLATHHGLVAPSLVGPPRGRFVARVLLGGLTETVIGLASGFKLLDGSVAGHVGDEGR
jgi:uncharacterized membrane protein